MDTERGKVYQLVGRNCTGHCMYLQHNRCPIAEIRAYYYRNPDDIMYTLPVREGLVSVYDTDERTEAYCNSLHLVEHSARLYMKEVNYIPWVMSDKLFNP